MSARSPFFPANLGFPSVLAQLTALSLTSALVVSPGGAGKGKQPPTTRASEGGSRYRNSRPRWLAEPWSIWEKRPHNSSHPSAARQHGPSLGPLFDPGFGFSALHL